MRGKSTKSWKLAPAILAMALLSLAGCGSNKASESGAQGPSVAPPPEASLAIPTLEGPNTSVTDYRGKVVLVNFWATWCEPCNTEIPWLIEFDKKYSPKGLVILGVAMDEDGKKVVDPWVKTKQYKVNGEPELMSYRILLGSDTIADKFGCCIGLPTSVLFGRDGRKIKTIIGLADYHDLANAIETQLAAPAPPAAGAGPS